jgi:drug/metabolite transporter (DMT)-like permease
VASRVIVGGVALAALAALAFGVTTPVVTWASRGVGAFAPACLLYAGAGAISIMFRALGGRGEVPLRRRDTPRLVAIALAGGVIAPTLLVWGLQRAGATIGALLLNLEALFTVVLARAVYREPIGTRVAIAVTLMTAGGGALTLDACGGSTWSAVGVAAIATATLAWATDNTLTRPLAERDPIEVVAAKGFLGAACTGVVAVATHQRFPPLGPSLALLGCGATGYGLSLRLYLLAQRRIGAGRTGSVFALAPFFGAALAYALGDRAAGWWTIGAAASFGVGVYLHATEHHGHRHVHAAQEHDHLHRHDDGHHTHTHDPPVTGEHAHLHRHEHVEHDHEHAPDLHHDHGHRHG